MIRLVDPVTRESIIRPYTPISETSQRGTMDVLIKLYLADSSSATDNESWQGGRMSRAISSIPLGHSVEFKGPVGKFTYLGQGLCAINSDRRRVRKFVMICGGSGITPIFQVFRAVLSDAEDRTVCTVLNGNRLEEDILCREALDALLEGNEHRAEICHTLSRPPDRGWHGRKGRIDEELIRAKCALGDFTVNAQSATKAKSVVSKTKPRNKALDGKNNNKNNRMNQKGGEVAAAATGDLNEEKDGEGNGGIGTMMVLICGPPAMEKSVHTWLNAIGWRDEDILFF